MNLYSQIIFPRLVDLGMQGDLFQAQRRQVLAPVSGQVLEVGFGTGLNLPYYPAAVTHLTAIDPNPGMNRRARSRLAPVSFPVELQVADATALPCLPPSSTGWSALGRCAAWPMSWRHCGRFGVS